MRNFRILHKDGSYEDISNVKDFINNKENNWIEFHGTDGAIIIPREEIRSIIITTAVEQAKPEKELNQAQKTTKRILEKVKNES